MAVQVGHYLKLGMCQDYLAETVCNIFYYIVAVWTGNVTLEDVLDVVITDLVDEIKVMQSVALVYDHLRIDDLTNKVDFAERGVNIPGIRPGNGLPSYVAMNFTLNRASKLTRPGAKRIAGLVEDDVSGNNWSSGTGMLDPIGAAMADPLAYVSGGDEFSLLPVVIGRDTTGGYDFSRISYVTSATPKLVLTSQTTRRPGRGI
jgi:hypothetical protein